MSKGKKKSPSKQQSEGRRRGKQKQREELVTLEFGPPKAGGKQQVIARRGDKVVHTDEIHIGRDPHRKRFIQAMADSLGVGVDTLGYLNERMKEESVNPQPTQLPTPEGPPDPLADTPPKMIKKAERMLRNPDIMSEIERDITALGVVGEMLLKLQVFMTGLSRLLVQPLSACVQAVTGSGKSHVVSLVLSLMPPESLISVTGMTANSLYYAGDLSHRIVFVAERRHESSNSSEAANANLPVREIISTGMLTKYTTVPTPNGRQAVIRETKGPIVLIETTTSETIYSEDRNRLLLLSADESPEQTRQVMRHRGREAAGLTVSEAERDAIRAKHHAAQRMLELLNVIIPYSEHIAIPTDVPAARRIHDHLLQMIKAVALLRQKQKPQRPDGAIEADLTDYEIAHRLMLPVIGRQFDSIGDRARSLLDAIWNQTSTDETKPDAFTLHECARWIGRSATETTNRLKVLIEAGYVVREDERRGHAYLYRAARRAGELTVAGLITPDQLARLLEKAA